MEDYKYARVLDQLFDTTMTKEDLLNILHASSFFERKSGFQNFAPNTHSMSFFKEEVIAIMEDDETEAKITLKNNSLSLIKIEDYRVTAEAINMIYTNHYTDNDGKINAYIKADMVFELPSKYKFLVQIDKVLIHQNKVQEVPNCISNKRFRQYLESYKFHLEISDFMKEVIKNYELLC